MSTHTSVDTPHSAIDQRLREARVGLDRVAPADLDRELAEGAVLVDIRPQAQRDGEGPAPDGTLVIDRNVLEWRLDPTSDARIDLADDHDIRWIILCSQGYASSLAAAELQGIGLHRATDLIGGYQALAEHWRTR
ncbi:rhodanese-like domain-containing protein [Gordonia jinhuaensis]|uniref:Rhodanese domain-containing protein n=1 Tax=Gordonia jinhuaensis TaxID=1517702 RepID=A0A916SZV3_9ACTN|nr:rhodanese-like domain-containing protein [Gordonia jinhuaensis]GGB23534.1 hypothetical protein GCM10011489_09750 [Gordonia jinhuaensis]